MKTNTLKLWAANILFVIGVGLLGFSGYAALNPASNLILVKITDADSMQNRVEGTPLRIPVAAVNETATRIRLVGTNAC